MSFNRFLSPQMVDALNRECDRNSWWAQLVNDPAVFIAVRPNALNAYASGGSIGRICFENENVLLKVHVEYLTLPADAESGRYVELTTAGTVPQARTIISNTDDFSLHLDRIKGRARQFSGKERQGENIIACNNSCVVDVEAAYSGDDDRSSEDEGETERGGGRLDMVTIDTEERLAFFEVKLHASSDLRSRTVPSVCNQLFDYHIFLKTNKDCLREAYTNVFQLYHKLSGNFFENRRRDLRDVKLDDVPRLLIFDFDTQQQPNLRNNLIPKIVEQCQKLMPEFEERYVQSVGSACNVTEQILSG